MPDTKKAGPKSRRAGMSARYYRNHTIDKCFDRVGNNQKGKSMKATIEMFRRLRDTAGHKVNRNFDGFFADRMTRAFSRENLTDAMIFTCVKENR